MFLLNVEPSTRKDKKYMATFCLCSKKLACKSKNVKVVHFGARGYEDYTTHKDKTRRDAYRARHKVYLTDDPTTPAQLSWSLLWGDSTSLSENIKEYKKRFNV